MTIYQPFFHSLAEHWKSLGITSIVAAAASTITWILARRKEWVAARKEKTERKIDAQILQSLQNRDLWKGPRPVTGSGDFAVRTAELADALKLENDTVADSLERLKWRGKVRNAGGTLDNPSPYWHILHR
jgi:hypothetical protein